MTTRTSSSLIATDRLPTVESADLIEAEAHELIAQAHGLLAHAARVRATQPAAIRGAPRRRCARPKAGSAEKTTRAVAALASAATDAGIAADAVSSQVSAHMLGMLGCVEEPGSLDAAKVRDVGLSETDKARARRALRRIKRNES